VDAIDADAGKAAVEKTKATFGHLDILVNNAGYCHSENV
jgi:NAD(P)-dependent dehydrogenase (short-subunit alcohol dehydrogenase family)